MDDARDEALILQLPDEPMVIGCYTFTPTGMEVRGTPTFNEHMGVGEWARRAYLRSGWWLADWLRYGESREDWKDRIQQAHELTGLALGTLRNIRVLGSVAVAQRRKDLDFGLYFPIASLEPDEQDEIIDLAVTEGWDRNDIRKEVASRKRATVIQGQAVLEGQHRVLSADCPWIYNNSQPSGSNAQHHFPGMTIEELCDLPVKAHATRHAVMGFWVPAPMLYDDPGPRDVITAWGFEYKAMIAWHKVQGAGGYYTKGDVELFLICTRGRGTPDVPHDLPSGVYVERKDPEHSRKPEFFRRYLEKHWTTGPRLELFGRRPAKGWRVFGNDPRLWNAA